MGTKAFTGSDGNWGTAGNWDPTGVPTSTDDVILNSSGNFAITGGLDQNAIDLNRIFVGDGYTKDIGSSASPLIISARKIIHRGKGTFYLKNLTGSTVPIDELIIAFTGTLQDLAMEFTGKPVVVAVSRGRATIDIAGLNDTQYVLLVPQNSSAKDVDVTLPGSFVAIPANVLVGGGTLTLQGLMTLPNAVVRAGVLNYEALSTLSLLTIHGGVCNVNHSGGSPRRLSTANILGGLVDLTGTKVDKIITTTRLWPNGRLKYFKDLTTFTNPIQEFDGRSVAP